MTDMLVVLLVVLSIIVSSSAQTAPSVTNLACANQNGQTFCTYTEPYNDPNWTYYRFQLYEASAIITSPATLVETNLYNGGYLNGDAPYNQTSRTDPTSLMSTISNLGSQLPFGTGIAVRTTPQNRSEYYAVVTIDSRNVYSPSPIVPGVNSLSKPVNETVAPIQPVEQLASTDPRSKTPAGAQIPANTSGLPLWLYLHVRGPLGYMPPVGEYWAMWGNSSMGFQDGVQQVAKVYYDKGDYGRPTLYAAPQDKVWWDTGAGFFNTLWTGMDWQGYVQPYTQNWLNALLPFWVSHYNLNPNMIYGSGESMGGGGLVYWGTRKNVQPFAAIFAEVPVWWWEGQIDSMTSHEWITTTTEPLPNTVTYYNDSDTLSWLSNCSNYAPPIIFANGRTDKVLPDSAMWTNAVAAADIMKACHRPYAFAWTNGAHNDEGESYISLRKMYQTSYVRNMSYPIFTNFSLDNDYGSGDITDGDCTTGITSPICYSNYGWKWSVTADQADIWQVSISNSQVTAGACPTATCAPSATVDISLGNIQSFNPQGKAVSYSTSLGQAGTVSPDSYGIYTVAGVNIGASGVSLTLTF